MNPNDDAGRARLNPATRDRLREELSTLREQRSALVASIGSDEPLGDTADQADALERADQIQRLDERIEEITDLLEMPAGTAGAPDGDRVEVGTVVTLRFGDGTSQALRVTPIVEEDEDTAVVTPDSPLGKVLLGRRPGQKVSYEAPHGQVQAEVVSVQAEDAQGRAGEPRG